MTNAHRIASPSRIEVESDVGTTLGDYQAGNYTQLAPDGEHTMEGTARVVNAMWVDAGGIEAPGAKPATAIAHGVLETPAWQFANQAVEGDQETVSFNMRIANRMDRSEALSVCVGWSTATTDPGDDSIQVKWQLEYLFTSPGESTAAAAQDTVSALTSAATVANGMCISIFTGMELPDAADICLHARLTRLSADAEDTTDDTVELHGIVLQWTSNKLGTAT